MERSGSCTKESIVGQGNWNKKVYGCFGCSIFRTYISCHSRSSPLPSSLFRSFSFSLFHSEPSWLNPRLSYFTVKIVECSFRARGLCSFTRRKYSQSKHASELSISLSRAFSDFLDELSRDLPSEALMHPEERFGNVRFGSSSFFSVFYFSISLSLVFWF